MIDTKTLEMKPDVPRVIAGGQFALKSPAGDKLIEADMEQSFALRSARHRGKAFVGWLSR